MFDKRINIFTGHFGSGKTEVAVNYTYRMAEKKEKVAIVDFDIVNPFFRATDARQGMEGKGIRVITPMYANTNVDVPALPAEINTIFENREYSVVFDVGGDDIGARALSRYRDSIENDSFEMFFVINARRPMTDTVEKIEDMIRSIEYTSRLKVTKLVNNTNLLNNTSPDDINEGRMLIENVSERLGIPIAFTAGFHSALDHIAVKPGSEVLYMDKHIKLPWD